MSHPIPGVRTAAASSLGWSGGQVDVAVISALVTDDVDDVRAAALGSLAELGGPDALDTLAREMESDRPGRLLVLRGLAWWLDPRGRDGLLADPASWLCDTYGGEAAAQLLAYGVAQDRHALVAAVRELLRRDLARDDIPVVQIRQQMTDGFRACEHLLNAVSRMRPELVDEVYAALGDDLQRLLHGNRWHRSYLVTPPFDEVRRSLKPISPRTVPCRRLTFGSALAGAHSVVAAPPDKFGGQPDWREEPAWPLSQGRPLPFYGQLPLPVEYGHPERTAYLFIGEPNDWEPHGPGNALVIQPGPPPHLPTAPLHEGPQRFDWVSDLPRRFRHRIRRLPSPPLYVTLSPGMDPEDWVWPDDDSPTGGDYPGH